MGGIVSKKEQRVDLNTSSVYMPNEARVGKVSESLRKVSGSAVDNVIIEKSLEPRIQCRVPHFAILLHPHFIPFLDFKQLSQLLLLNRYYANAIKEYDVDLGYWQAMCSSFAAHRGLYYPHEVTNPKEYFFREMWQCNRKWRTNETDQVQNFQIRVGSRFRPGARCQNRFALPLHQFLKVRSQQLQKQGNEAVFVGETIPERFLDPLLSTVMTNPVMLPDSERIVDRSVALASKQDPFTGSRLEHSKLIALPELAQEISEFKQRQLNVDISVASTDALELVNTVDPSLLEAMVAVDQLNCVAERAHYEASHVSQRTATAAAVAAVIGDDDNGAGDQAAPEVHEELVGIGGLGEGHVRTDVQNEIHDDPFMDADVGEDSRGLPTMGHGNLGQSRWAKAKNDSARLVDVSGDKATVTMNIPGSGIRPFSFNHVFPDKDGQLAVYTQAARDLVVSCLNGSNGCLLCYGQTGSGKTHTMFGPPDGKNPLSVVDVNATRITDSLSDLNAICDGDNATGIVVRACAEMLRAKLLFTRRGDVQTSLSAQFVEIYNETVTDLMTGKRVSIRRATGEVNGALDVPINSIEDAAELLRMGNMRKHFAATAMNDRSSRSHTALILHISQTSLTTNMHIRSSLYLVDLAGSERVKKSQAAGTQLREAQAINYSLLVLGKVITRLSRSALHIPYYESQLTTMLKGALGGNCRTGVVVTCRSDDRLHGDETLQSLRFGELCGMISNSTRQAASSVANVVKCLDDAIAQVTAQMDSLRNRGKSNIPSFASLEVKLKDLRVRRDHIILSPSCTGQ